MEGLGFDTYLGHRDSVLGQSTLYICIILYPGVTKGIDSSIL